MKLSWLDPLQPDERLLAGAVAVVEAASRAYHPHHLAANTTRRFHGMMKHGWEENGPAVAVTHDENGRVAGVVEAWLPSYDNRHLAALYMSVDPVLRRRGIGRLLVEGAIDHARAQHRTVVVLQLPEADECAAFAGALGFEQQFVQHSRRQDLLTLDWAQLDAEYAQARQRAADYELVQVPGATPDELIDAIAGLTEAINDAPTDGLDVEDEVFDAGRIRAFEAAQVGRGVRLYRLVARHRESGELAGHTVVGVDSDQPWSGGQYDTSVVRAHRGHGLGMLLKIAMLRWLAEEEPQLRAIDTGNAASNTHMIAVNEALGYKFMQSEIGWQRHLDQ